MSAARPRRSANAAAIRSSPVCGTAGTRSRAGLAMPLAHVTHLGEVLVAAARQADEIKRRCAAVLMQRVVQRVRGLEGRDDALEPGDLLEGLHRVVVLDGDVPRAPRVAQVG